LSYFGEVILERWDFFFCDMGYVAAAISVHRRVVFMFVRKDSLSVIISVNVFVWLRSFLCWPFLWCCGFSLHHLSFLYLDCK